MKVLVTGGCGFVGSHLAERLLAEGFEIRILDLNRNLQNIQELVDNKKVEFVRGDITDEKACKRAIEGCDIVSHLAALVSVDQSISEPERFFETNVGGTFRILEAAREARIKRFHYISTCEVLGQIDEPLRADESWSHPAPRSPYAASKFAAEGYCRSYYATYDLPIVITRCFNVYGPRQNPGSRGAVIPKLITRVLAGDQPQIFGDGKQTRDWTYVADIVDGIYRSISEGGIDGELFHLASGTDRRVIDVAEEIIELCDKGGVVSPSMVSARPGEVRRSAGDASKAKRILNWAPKVSFREGLERTIEYFEVNPVRREPPSK